MILGASPLASVPLASSSRRAATDAPDVTGTRVYLAGSDVTDLLMSLEMSESLGTRWEARIDLVSEDGNYHADAGAAVRIVENGAARFGGQIEEIEEESPDGTVCLFLRITATDYSDLFNRHFVNKAFVEEGQTLRDIVVDLILSSSGGPGETLYDAGIRYGSGSIAEGPPLGRIIFADVKVSEAMDRLCELAGFSWWVDANHVLYCQDSATVRAPAPLDATTQETYGGTSHSITRADYRNIQILKAGKRRTDVPRTQTFVGDGEATTWTLNLPVADKPRIWIGGVEVDPSDIAIKETDDDALWVYEVGADTISQQDSEEYPVVAEGVEIAVEYLGLYPIKVRARNDGEIVARKAAEGGVGIYAEIESDERIDDFDLALRRVRGLLSRHGKISEGLRVRTSVAGYHAGQIVRVVLGQYRVFADFLIESVTARLVAPIPEMPFEYELSLINNAAPGGWAAWFRDLARLRSPTISENETIHEHLQVAEKVRLSDSLTIQEGDQRDHDGNALMLWDLGYLRGSQIGRRRRDAAGTLDAGMLGGPLIGLSVKP